MSAITRRADPTPTSRPFFAALADGSLAFQRCAACGVWAAYPRPHCVHCLSTDVALVPVSGNGRVHSWTVVHRGPSEFRAMSPYVHAVVELDVGVRLATQLVDVPHPSVGEPVVAVIDHYDGKEHPSALPPRLLFARRSTR